MALVIKNKVKELSKSNEMRTSNDFIEALDKEVEKLVKSSIKRAKENGRQTLKARDA